MSISNIPKRADLPDEEKWNASSVFESKEAWDEETKRIAAALDGAAEFKGRLAEGSGVLAEALEHRDGLLRRMNVAYLYAGMEFNVDMSNQESSAAIGKAQGLYGKVLGAFSHIEPEVIAIGREKVLSWVGEEGRLAPYEHYFDNLFRMQKHIRSDEVEELLALLEDPFSGPSTTASKLTCADFQFDPVVGGEGEERALTQGTLDIILAGGDREARRTAWENYMDRYVEHRNTLASNLETSIRQNAFQMRARRHETTLEAALFQDAIPVKVFHNLIDTFRENLPTWHRYWDVRRKGLGVEKLHPYDIWAPLTANKPVVSFEQAMEWVCDGLAPMGDDYVATMRKGCTEDRWVDWRPNEGKTAGAFSWGAHGTFPFIVMSFGNDMGGLSTLAHELGHSMHSFLAWQTQPFIYSEYSLFAAETASNFHQAMVRAHLFQANSDRDFQISLIEEAMDNFHRYFFIMPTLARFELETHRIVERGEGLTAEGMIDLMVELFQEGYGGKVHVDRERVGMTWATFGHLFTDYYVYAYATGISAAHSLSNRILAGEENGLSDYLGFLKAGGSAYPLEALRSAGVDMTRPDAVEETYGVLAGMIDRLEELLDQ